MKNKNEIKDKSIGFDNRQSFGLHEIMCKVKDEDNNWSYYKPIDELKLFWNDFLTKELGCYEDGNWNDDVVLCDGFMEKEIEELLLKKIRDEFISYIINVDGRINPYHLVNRNLLTKDYYEE